MDLFNAVVLGVVEGISEFLPISSTGHLILASHLIGLDHTEFLKSFEISIQLGAILSVVVLYWRMLLVDIEVIKRVIVAFIPTGALGFLFYKLIKRFLLGSSSVVLWSLLVGGALLILFEWLHREEEEKVESVGDMSYRHAFLIGIFQSIAMVPGISRSASTIVGGLMLGLRRKTIVEFSFLLAVPTMLAATVYDLLKSGSQFNLDQVHLMAVGFICSFVVAIFSIKFLIRFIKTHTFIPVRMFFFKNILWFLW